MKNDDRGTGFLLAAVIMDICMQSEQKLIKTCCLKYFQNPAAHTGDLEIILVFKRLAHHQKNAEPRRGNIGHTAYVQMDRPDIASRILELLQ